ncbi:MAG: polysaccharide deacetylase family protein [Verrucomicrobiota bacterium]
MRPLATILLLCLLSPLTLLVAEEAENPKRLLPIPDKLVVLTFDDANKSDRTLVADELKKHGFGATFYVTEGLGFLKSKTNYTTWKEIRELHDMGFEIGNHTKAHRNVTQLTKETFSESLDHIDRRCAENGIPRPVTFCFPGFSHNQAAVEVLLAKKVFTFARRGVRPEFKDGGRGGLGPAYDPHLDHPLLVPTTWYAGPESGTEDMKKAVAQAKDGKIAVLCYHGVPSIEHPWVTTEPEAFKEQLAYLKSSGCTVIAMRDLQKYVDPTVRPEKPYENIKRRTSAGEGSVNREP